MKSSLLFTFAMLGIAFGVYGQMPGITLTFTSSNDGVLIVFRS
jgi:hypothetical protein